MPGILSLAGPGSPGFAKVELVEARMDYLERAADMEN
jgi:hypothetical protein